MVVFGKNSADGISKLLCIVSQAERRVKFEKIVKYHRWYLCQI